MVDNSAPIQVGVVGLGSMGHWHADLLGDTECEVIAGADISPDARTEFEQKYGSTTYPTHEDLYENEDLDAVVVTTPNKVHEPAAVDAFEADIDLLLEKPLAHSLASAERIAAAAESSNAFGMVGFHNRFRNTASALRAYVERGDLGEVTRIETNYIRRRGIPGRGTWFTSKELSGGGALIDIGVHIIDLTLHVLGHPEIAQVAGVTRQEFGDREDYEYLDMWGEDTDPSKFDVEDSAMAMVQTEKGQTISLDIAWATNGEGEENIILRGTEAGATLDKMNDELTLHETRRVGVDQHVDLAVETPDRDIRKAQTERFVSAVRANDPPGINTIDEALTVQRIIEAIYQSSEHGGRPVRLGQSGATVQQPVMLD